MTDRPACIIYHQPDDEAKVRIDVWATGDLPNIAEHFLGVHTDLCCQGRCRMWAPLFLSGSMSSKIYDFVRLPWASGDIVLDAVQLALHTLNYGKLKLLGMKDHDVLPNEWRRFAELSDMRKMLRDRLECDVPALAWLFE